jgi:hypothetical protein
MYESQVMVKPEMKAPTAAPRTWTAERVFYTGMACVSLLVIFIGFAPSYFLRGLIDAGHPLLPMSPLVHVHGLVFSLWVLLFITQTGLIATRRTAQHRRLGIFGVLLAIAMIVIGTVTGLQGVVRASGPPTIPPLVWLAVPLFDIVVFATLVCGAILARRVAQTHKRLMLIAMIGLLGPAVGRMPWPHALYGGVAFYAFFFLIPLMVWDFKSLGRLHFVTVLGTVFLVGMQMLRLAVWHTEAWLRFATWAVSAAT